jgi:hypothetical protein
MRRSADRGQARVRDRGRRQPEMDARVVRRRVLELRLEDRLGRRDVQAVAQRRVDPELHPVAQPVVDHRGDKRPLARDRDLPLDHRRDLQHVIRRQVLRARVAHVHRLPVAAERLELRLHELPRGCLAKKVVGRRKEEALEIRTPGPAEAGDDLVAGCSEVHGLAQTHRPVALMHGDLRDHPHAHGHLRARQPLLEDDVERRGRRRHRWRRRRLRSAPDEQRARRDDDQTRALRHARKLDNR